MALPLSRALEDCRREEGKLAQLLTEDSLKFQQVEQVLTRQRAICSDALLADFSAAAGQGFKAEDRLWDNHQKVNARFRTALATTRNSTGQRAVELRKLAHEYLKFIKNSQSFYRNFIKRLNQTYGGIPSLERVAKKLHTDLYPHDRVSSSQATALELEQCCHRTLIRLGDLSRYRETELAGSEKNWAPAYGYYDLALSICPASGVPFNQRAVIALAEKTLFRAVYYVYRSLSAEDPHPQADMNLRRALQRVQQAWNSKELVNDPKATTGAVLPRGVVAWYLRLLEMFYHGKATPERDSLEKEVLSQLQVDMKKSSSADAPHKLIVTGIAAQYAAQERFQNKHLPAHQNSYLLVLQLNVKMFSTFLQIVIEELETFEIGPESGEAQISKQAAQLTFVLKRALPVLRLYDLWLDTTCEIIDSPASGFSDEQKGDLWSAYAKALTGLTAAFPPQQSNHIDHMLEEDEDLIGFRPLNSGRNRVIWYQNDRLKPRWHEASTGEERHEQEEMLFRIREFIVRGLELVVSERVPIDFDKSDCRFSYRRTGQPDKVQTDLPQESEKESEMESSNLRRDDAPNLTWDAVQEEEAMRMVDDIVGNAVDDPELNNVAGAFSLPATPPQPSTNRSTFGTSSPFPMGTHTVNDIMAVAYKQPKSTSPKVQAPTMQQSYSHSRPSSVLHSPALPRIPSDSSTGSTINQSARLQYYPEDPQLPGLGVFPVNAVQSTQSKLSSPTGGRPSPLPPPPSHSRVNSSEARGIWGGGIFTPSYHPTDARRNSGGASPSFENNVVGTPSLASSRVPSSFPDAGKGSPALQNGSNSPWNYNWPDNKVFTSKGFAEEGVASDHTPGRLSWSGVAGRGKQTERQPT